MAEITVTDTNFETEVKNYKGQVLLDFWAAWCGPCRMLGPLVEQISEEYAGKLKVGKVNVDEEMGLASQFGISSIPTLILFRDGVPVKQAVGFMPKAELAKLIEG